MLQYGSPQPTDGDSSVKTGGPVAVRHLKLHYWAIKIKWASHIPLKQHMCVELITFVGLFGAPKHLWWIFVKSRIVFPSLRRLPCHWRWFLALFSSFFSISCNKQNAHDTLFRSVNHWGVIRPVWSSPKIFRGHHQLCSTSPGTFPYIITYDTYVAHVPGRSWHQNFLASAPLAPPALSSPTCLGILDASPGSQGSQGSDMGGIPMGRWFSSWKILWKWMITGGIPISGTPIRWFP